MEFRIGTLASHSALGILAGARAEGFKTLLFSPNQQRRRVYDSFNAADETIVLEKGYSDLLRVCDDKTILIPHGSFVSYLPIEELITAPLEIFGSRELLKWEADRMLKAELLQEANLRFPAEFTDPEIAKYPCIVKYHGAKGGKNFFVAKNKQELKKKLTGEPAVIQEYITGAKVYTTYFQSVMRDRLEIFGTDIRYESSIDAKLRFDDTPSFTVVGNLPAILRESLLEDYLQMGIAFSQAVKRKLGTELIGPFCLETIVDPELRIWTFEFSGRIVAGTNIYIPHSPYSYLLFGKEMWMGRRIALEIRESLERNQLRLVCT
ncbi:MAG: formate--phosphoribosylaminoimidazolecarboxamide ligase [Candidatus Heimdallarchaeota archaeon]